MTEKSYDIGFFFGFFACVAVVVILIIGFLVLNINYQAGKESVLEESTSSSCSELLSNEFADNSRLRQVNMDYRDEIIDLKKQIKDRDSQITGGCYFIVRLNEVDENDNVVWEYAEAKIGTKLMDEDCLGMIDNCVLWGGNLKFLDDLAICSIELEPYGGG